MIQSILFAAWLLLQSPMIYVPLLVVLLLVAVNLRRGRHG